MCRDGKRAAATRYQRWGMGTIGASYAWAAWTMGRDCKGQPTVYQRRVLDFAYWGGVAGFAALLWEVGHGISAVPQMAGQGDLGETA